MSHDTTQLDWLSKWKMYAPKQRALLDGDTTRAWTYSELWVHARALAITLAQDYGVQKGDRVAVLSLNELEYVALFFATSVLGATIVPVNYRLTPSEVGYIVKDCEAKLLIAHDDFRSVGESAVKIAEGKTGLKAFRDVIEKAQNLQNHIESLSSLQFRSTEDDIAMIIYTSGTTGFPKGAMLSHRMLFWNSINTFLRLDITRNDVAVIFLPLFHTGGWNVLTTPFLHHGATIILTKKFDADQILKLSQDHKATLLFGVPTTMDMMARHPAFDSIQLQSLRYAIVGGEPMPLELIQKWHKKGIAIRQGYGLTEFGPNVFSLNEEDCIRKIGSIGFPNFYIQAKVVDDHGQECKANEVGELWLKGPSQMTGYFGHEKATAETFSDGWLLTGDLVRQDDEGYFYVVGRKKEMYKSGGENVYPAEVEKVIRSYPGVREVAVIGVKDEKWGEVGCAFISLENGITQISDQSLTEFCVQHLAKFKVPKRFKFLSEIPKGDSGKILKKNLRELVQ